MTELKKNRGRRFANMPLYPFLLGALPSVHFMEVNFRLLQTQDVLRPLVFTVLLSGALLLAGNAIWRCRWTTALVLSPLLTVLYKGQAIGIWPSLLLPRLLRSRFLCVG